MVSDLSNRDRDRGQLILIGGITLAFVILGIVVVFNGVLFTQTMASSSTTETTDVEVAEYEIRQSVQGTVQRTNLDDGSDLTDAEERLVPPYRNATVGDRPSIVDVTEVEIDEDAQWYRSTLEEGEVFNATDDHEDRTEQHVGRFALLIDTDDDGDLTFSVDGEDVDVEHDNEQIDIVTGCELEYEDQDVVEIDFVAGTTNASELDGDCDDLDLIDPSDEIETIEFDDDTDDIGMYEIVAKGNGDLTPDIGGDDAVWQADVTYQYDSSDVTAEREITVDIYGDRR
ncbi:hypothetical protein [Natrialbaceae archaeon AArc-T1-2]|uniref:hypothetical protein n=1 Tax=Natrialbaceae archaeon AArc-T1-2 TaxID=3053904 RepID=UPI00255B145C|nr:hypothetical protein [Natrialbaceae archaeon AArc-T1-2]WIV67780.1 hypothetical protein QQ977_03345 [Natrialbaceae archaeon AArc-T1-2]